jgi:hypothetical protein
LAETGFGRNVATGTNVASGSVEVVLGEAEWAATQTVHFAASVALEWLWVTNSTADIKVNSRHTQAIDLEIDRMIWIRYLNLHRNGKQMQLGCLSL